MTITTLQEGKDSVSTPELKVVTEKTMPIRNVSENSLTSGDEEGGKYTKDHGGMQTWRLYCVIGR